MLRFPERLVLSGAACALLVAVGLVAWVLAAGTSEAQAGLMHNCPPAGKWSIAVWEGESGTATTYALSGCGFGAVAAAYSLDAQTGAWSRWFADKPDVSNLPPLNDMQGVLALGGMSAAASGGALTAAQASGELHNCPLAGKWSLAVWEGPDGTAAADALAGCGAGAVAAAYSLHAQTGSWSRWFVEKPDVSNLPPLNDMQGVLAFGSATAAAPSATPMPSRTPTPAPSATPVPSRTPTPAPTPTPSPTSTPMPDPGGVAVLVAQDGEYLGVVTCNPYDVDGIFNKYGLYGSKYSSTSIWNKYGLYGGKYASYSPFNKYSSSAPEIVDSLGFLAYLSVNEYLYPVIDPLDLVYYCFQNDSYQLEYWLELVVDNTS